MFLGVTRVVIFLAEIWENPTWSYLDLMGDEKELTRMKRESVARLLVVKADSFRTSEAWVIY